MSNIILYLVFPVVVLFLAFLWMIYLIKIVLNDEEVQEKIRRIRRRHEEEIRARDDRLRKAREEQERTTPSNDHAKSSKNDSTSTPPEKESET